MFPLEASGDGSLAISNVSILFYTFVSAVARPLLVSKIERTS
ncbi:hypothetical protein SP41_26 [Salmonella phage 41]|nr:hypothetical protein SP41_26 [Salmonella phage 41]